MGGFGYLGAGAIVGQSVTGIKTGTAAAGLTTSVGAGASSALGFAAAGSVVPIIGTAIGLIVGLVASGVLNHRTDPEVGNFNQAIAMANASGPAAVVNIADKYLVLAGLFDLEPNQVGPNFSPYSHYGRLGELRFTTDMMNLIYNAAQAGQITANDTPQSIFLRFVNPWIQQMGPWTASMPNYTMLQYLLMGMIADYVTGNQTAWHAVNGDYPFASLPHFALPVAAPVAASTSGTPTPATQIPATQSPLPVGATIAPAQPIAPGAALPVAGAGSPPAAATYVPPAVVLSTDGSVMSPGSNTGLQTSAGTFTFGTPAGPSGDYPIFLNAQFTQGAALQAAILNGTFYVLNSGGVWYAWNGTWVAQSMAPTENTAPGSSVPSIFSPSVPGVVSQAPMYSTQPVSYYPTPAPAVAAVTAAGVSGLPTWLTIAGVGAGVLVLMFAGARPASAGRSYQRKR